MVLTRVKSHDLFLNLLMMVIKDVYFKTKDATEENPKQAFAQVLCHSLSMNYFLKQFHS